jgi:hypothetical protein
MQKSSIFYYNIFRFTKKTILTGIIIFHTIFSLIYYYFINLLFIIT